METLPNHVPPRSSTVRWAVRLALLAGGTYLGLCLMLALFENWLVYHPLTAQQDWNPSAPHNVEDLFLTTTDGTRIHAWWCPAPGSDKAVLFCHGNAGNLSHRAGMVEEMRAALGVSVLIFDYPGYGKSDGSPSEMGCNRAADACYDWLVKEKKMEPGNLLLFGDSLGGGVAVELAGRREHGALILVRTFTTLPDVGGKVFPWLPVHWLMRNRFDNVGTIKKCGRPVFFGHGTADSLIPHVLGKQLYDAANEPKYFFDFPGDDHNDALPREFYSRLREFLRTSGAL